RRGGYGRCVQLHLSGAAGAEGSSVASYPGDGGPCVEGAVAAFLRALLAYGATVDPAGATAPRAAASRGLLDPQRTNADRTTGLQHAVSLVRGAWNGRRGLGRDHVYEEPGSAACGRHRATVLRAGVVSGPDVRADVG